MRAGVQFAGTVAGEQTMLWYSYNWPQAWQVIWSVVPVQRRAALRNWNGMSRSSAARRTTSPIGSASRT